MDKQLNISTSSLFGYGVLALPVAMAGIPLYINAPDFYSTSFDLSLQKIGLLLLMIRCADAVIDPVIGLLSDRYYNHKKFIFSAAIFFLGSGFYLLFNPVQHNILLSFTAGLFIATVSFSVLTINLTALGGIWSDDYNMKTRISAWREGLGLIGLIIAAMLPGIISSSRDIETFHKYSLIMLAVLLISSAIFYILWLSRFEFKDHRKSATTINLFTQILSALTSKKHFFLIYFISMLASAIPAVLIVFFVRDRLGMEKNIGLFLIVYFLAGAVSMPLWGRISNRSGKKHAWIYAMLLSIATFIWAYFIGHGDFYPYLAICLLSGLAFGAELALPPAILADMTDRNACYTLDYSLLTFLSKLSFALASGLALYALGSLNYIPAQHNDIEILRTISFLYALLPCIIKAVAAAILFRSINQGEQHVDKIINLNNGSNHA